MEYLDNCNSINSALDDFCDFAARRIVVASGDFELEAGTDAGRFLKSVKGIRGHGVSLENGIFLLL